MSYLHFSDLKAKKKKFLLCFTAASQQSASISCLQPLSPLTLLGLSSLPASSPPHPAVSLQSHWHPLGNSNSQLHLRLTWPTVSIDPVDPAPSWTISFLWLPRHYALLFFLLPHWLSLYCHLSFLLKEGAAGFWSLVLHAYSLGPYHQVS